MFELVRNLQLNEHITVSVEADPIGDMSHELCMVERPDSTILLANVLLLTRTMREFFRFVIVYSIPDSGGGAVCPAWNIGAPSLRTACPFSIL